MNAPKDITGPEDLASTVRNATDPLEEYPNYGTATNRPGDKTSRPEEISELLDERTPTASTLLSACEQHIKAHPTRSVVIAAGAGAAAATLLVLMAQALSSRR